MRVVHDGDERDVFIDVVRVVAVVVVVVAHWATTTVVWEEGRIAAENALSFIPETHLVTWLIQVMPLIFFAGGFANARSLARHGGQYLAYLRTRLVRLLAPTVVFLSVWLVVGIVAELLPLPEPNVVESAADVAALPFWFLGIYVVVVALAPVMQALHERFGLGVPGFLVGGAVVVDVVVHGLGYEVVGVANYAFVWLLPHQLGFFYAEGRFDRWSAKNAGGLVATGLGALVLVVAAIGYPVSMVGVPGEERWNTDPPSVALVALTLWLIGLALLARPGVRRAAERWQRRVLRLRSVTLTTFLWHVTALAAAAIAYPLGFPRSEIGSGPWWAGRPLWVAAALPVLALLVACFRRFEVHPRPRELGRRHLLLTRRVVAGMAVVSLALGLLGFGVTGFDHVATGQGETLLAFSANPLQNLLHVAVGIALLGAVSAPSSLVPAAGAAAVLHLGLGAAGWSQGVRVFAMNPSTAVLLVVVGSLEAVLLGLAGRLDRRASQGPPEVEAGPPLRSGR
jgi:surface polysaccharide O-acyltransferase-like enzyme